MAKRKRKKKGTISSAPSSNDPQHIVAGVEDTSMVQTATPSTLTEKRTTTMAEDELGSIVEYTEDLADAEAPDPLPSREYDAQITRAEQKFSNTSGKRYAAVTFSISTDQFPPDYPIENNPDGVNIIYRMVPLEDNPKARFQARRFIEAIGATPGKRIDLNDWVGQTAVVGVQHDDYEGVTREIITKVTAN